jgi:hypothetical protein
MCLYYQVSVFFATDESLWRFTIYITNSEKFRCHADMTAKGGYLPRVRGSGSEGDTGTAGNTK